MRKAKTPPPCILFGALSGDVFALERLLHFYDPYINRLSTLSVYDCNGELVTAYVDDDRKQIISVAFIRGVRSFAGLVARAKI